MLDFKYSCDVLAINIKNRLFKMAIRHTLNI